MYEHLNFRFNLVHNFLKFQPKNSQNTNQTVRPLNNNNNDNKKQKSSVRQRFKNTPMYIKNHTKMAMKKIISHFNKGAKSPDLEKNYIVHKEILGKGSFAVVKKCTDKQTNVDYALKIIPKSVIKGKEQMLTTELDVLKKVNHPHLVTLHDLFETKDNVYIITDLASGGELYNQLLQKGSYTEKDAAHILEQVLQGVAYLHDHDIVHRDLKPENLLFSDAKSQNPKLMITDFGLSKILKNHDDILMTACGTPGYVAPEVLSQKGYSKPCDIWSAGVILYTVLCGYTPFWGQDQTALFDSILKGKYEFDNDYWDDISDEAKDLINKMLTYNPDRRITARDALKHHWFEYAAALTLDSSNSQQNNNNIRSGFQSRATLKKAIHVIQGVTRMRRISRSHVKNFDDYTDGIIGAGVGHGSNDRMNIIVEENNNNSDPSTLGSSGLFGNTENLGVLHAARITTNSVSELPITNQMKQTEFTNRNISRIDVDNSSPTNFGLYSNYSVVTPTDNSVPISCPHSISPTSPTATASNTSIHAIIV